MTKVYDDPWLEVPGRCNARKTNGEGLCRKGAGHGTDHVGSGRCQHHGGCTPNGRTHARRLLANQQMAELIATELKGVDVVDPIAAVMAVVRDSFARMRVYQALIGELVASDQVEGAVGIYGPNHLGDLGPHPLVVMLERETARHLSACKVAIDQGVAERALRIEEDKLDVMIRGVRAILEALGHDLNDPHVQDVIVTQLRALPAGDRPPVAA